MRSNDPPCAQLKADYSVINTFSCWLLLSANSSILHDYDDMFRVNFTWRFLHVWRREKFWSHWVYQFKRLWEQISEPGLPCSLCLWYYLLKLIAVNIEFKTCYLWKHTMYVWMSSNLYTMRLIVRHLRPYSFWALRRISCLFDSLMSILLSLWCFLTTKNLYTLSVGLSWLTD